MIKFGEKMEMIKKMIEEKGVKCEVKVGRDYRFREVKGWIDVNVEKGKKEEVEKMIKESGIVGKSFVSVCEVGG